MVPYSVHVIWSNEDEAFLATISELPGLTAFGDSQQEALEEAINIAEEMIAIKEDYGESIPEPLVKKEYSGQTRLRLPKSLHESLAKEAELEGISLNTSIVHLLTKNYTINAIEKIHKKERKRLQKIIQEKDSSITIKFAFDPEEKSEPTYNRVFGGSDYDSSENWQ